MNDFNSAELEDIEADRMAVFIAGVVSLSQDYATAGAGGFGVKERLDMEEHLLDFFGNPFLLGLLQKKHAEEKTFRGRLGKHKDDDGLKN